MKRVRFSDINQPQNLQTAEDQAEEEEERKVLDLRWLHRYFPTLDALELKDALEKLLSIQTDMTVKSFKALSTVETVTKMMKSKGIPDSVREAFVRKFTPSLLSSPPPDETPSPDGKENASSICEKMTRRITWPNKPDVKLKPIIVSDSHKSIPEDKRTMKASPVPGKEKELGMLLYKLGEKFVTGDELKDYPSVRLGKYTALIAPPGAGKTRRLFELLYHQFGWFIPYKPHNDSGNDGSEALFAVCEELKREADRCWRADDPDDREFVIRRERAEFAIHCVLISYHWVFHQWRIQLKAREIEPPSPYEWLLVQLFPIQFLGDDYFQNLAVELFLRADVNSISNFDLSIKDFPPFHCIIDEAQALGNLLAFKFRSQNGQSTTRANRSLLSPILSGIHRALGRHPILSGTGLNLLNLEDEVVPRLGCLPDSSCCFTSFPMLSRDEVESVIRVFLVQKIDEEPRWLKESSSWLQGRPGFVNQFITYAMTNDCSLKDCFKNFKQWILSETVSTPAVDPVTIADSFQKLRRLSATGSESYYSALKDAFLLSCGGRLAASRYSPEWIECGIGYYCDQATHKTLIRFEPLVLEMARIEIMHDFLGFEREFLTSGFDPTANGTHPVELLMALKLQIFLTSYDLEANPLIVPSGVNLPMSFRGKWEARGTRFGCFARKAANPKEFCDWFFFDDDSTAGGTDVIFPPNPADPDIVFHLYQGNAVMTMIVRIKATESFDDSQLKEALMTIDPAKFYHRKPNEQAQKATIRNQKRCLKKLKEGPVIRMVVSALSDVSEQTAQMIDGDLLLIVDSRRADDVLGSSLVTKMRQSKQQLPLKMKQIVGI